MAQDANPLSSRVLELLDGVVVLELGIVQKGFIATAADLPV